MYRKIKIFIIMIAVVFIFKLLSISAQEEFTVAYYASPVSDATAEIAFDFLANVQERLLEYDVEISLTQWVDGEDRPDGAIVYLYFDEQFIGERVITGVDVTIATNANNLETISPILEDNHHIINFTLSEPNVENLVTSLILYSTGDLAQAEELLNLVQDIELSYGNIEAYIGNLRLLQGDYEGAIPYYEENIWSSIGKFYGVNLAWTYFQLGRTDECFALLDDAIEQSLILRETYPEHLLSVRAQLNALTFDYDSAIADIDEAISLAEENELDTHTLAELYTIRGEIIFLIYEWDRVEDNFDTAIELDPDYAPAYFQRGVLFYTMARRDDALADFESYLELEPDGLHAEEAEGYIESIQIELDALDG